LGSQVQEVGKSEKKGGKQNTGGKKMKRNRKDKRTRAHTKPGQGKKTSGKGEHESDRLDQRRPG